MAKNRLENSGDFNNFRNFYEWLQLESQIFREHIQTPKGRKEYEKIRQAECATMLELMLPAHRRTAVVSQNKTGVVMCSCMDARRHSNMGEPVVFVCKEHQERFNVLDCYREEEIAFFLELYAQDHDSSIVPESKPEIGIRSDEDFLKDLGISPD